MTALAEIQRDWTKNAEAKKITGVLFWDLLAAFNTLNSNLLFQKLRLYGCNTKTCKWFNSFLTRREQAVRIGNQISRPLQLRSEYHKEAFSLQSYSQFTVPIWRSGSSTRVS